MENVSHLLKRNGHPGTECGKHNDRRIRRESTIRTDRKTAAEALGNLRDIRCLVALKNATRDQSREVRLAATMALQEIFKAHKLN